MILIIELILRKRPKIVLVGFLAWCAKMADGGVYATLASALALRSAAVRVILAAEGDSSIMDAGNISTARTLIQEGAKLYRYPKMAHLKVMVCDDWATMGSANLDFLSMRINRELNIAFSDKAEVEKLVGPVFRPDFAKSKRMKLEDTESAIAPLAEVLADQL